MSQFTKISTLGEFGLIDKLQSTILSTYQNTPHLQKGIGDDCAVFALTDTESQVITTDLLMEQIHFDLLTTPLEHLGYKSISVNVSDIYAMNAVPLYALVSIGLSDRISVEMIEAIYRGMEKAAQQYKISIVGGDTSASVSGLLISITLIGKQETKKIIYRDGAKVGDVLCVTGDLGRSYAGLKILMRERSMMLEANQEKKSDEYQPFIKDYQQAIQKHILPLARKDIINFFATHNIKPTSMIDISDGLGSEIKHLCKQSNVGALLEEIQFPILNQTKEIADLFSDDSTIYALYGGEDYELLFTISPKDISLIEKNDDITIIGRIVSAEQGIKMKSIYNEEVDLAMKKGFDHFPTNENQSIADD